MAAKKPSLIKKPVKKSAPKPLSSHEGLEPIGFLMVSDIVCSYGSVSTYRLKNGQTHATANGKDFIPFDVAKLMFGAPTKPEPQENPYVKDLNAQIAKKENHLDDLTDEYLTLKADIGPLKEAQAQIVAQHKQIEDLLLQIATLQIAAKNPYKDAMGNMVPSSITTPPTDPKLQVYKYPAGVLTDKSSPLVIHHHGVQVHTANYVVSNHKMSALTKQVAKDFALIAVPQDGGDKVSLTMVAVSVLSPEISMSQPASFNDPYDDFYQPKVQMPKHNIFDTKW